MPDPPSISRRQALGAVGGAATGVGGYIAGVRSADSVPDWLAGRDCAPSPLATNPTDWPFPRHDRANTRHAPARAGPDWPPDRTWEREWPVGDVYELRPLIVVDGVVVALIEAAPQSVLLAISLADGRVLWRREAEDASYAQVCAAGGMAFVEGEVPDSPVRFAARSLGDGAALWTDSVSSHVPRTLAGGRLLAVDRTRDDNFAVTARDARTGVECWRAVHGGRPHDIAVADGRVVLPTRDDGVLALDPASGDRQWRSDAGGDTAAVVAGRVISRRFPGELRALSLADGAIEWRVQSEHFLEDGESDDGTRYARPGFEVGAVTPEVVVYALDVHSDYPSRLQARDLETGDLLWDVGPEPTPVEFHGYSRPIVVGDDLFAIRYARREDSEDPPDALLRFDVATGTERDRITFPADEYVRPPIVADTTLLVPTNLRLVAYT
ncbi:PQQ-like beta-propeller repeat protein [Halosolutus halophilus]|uniref:PQQ-like beta-propeller repeat protein n=1 Tax=Halosolutus halophilus TaxID=1552990 RepID=UPI002234F1C0|nr:PQQ-like beta-propeller repeat protein [Halosolutus halophilus]